MPKPLSPLHAPATPRQLEVLRLIGERLASGRNAPGYRDLLTALGVSSTNAIRSHIDALVRKELLRREDREVWPTPAGWNALGLEEPRPRPIRRSA
jgi:SOS-response transcriptional repressor LexA